MIQIFVLKDEGLKKIFIWLGEQDGITLITIGSVVGVPVAMYFGYSPLNGHIAALPVAGVIIIFLKATGYLRKD
ncbi:hypothetical protein ELS19_06175 [Halogeometricum borinquense]|uniref:Uncharacterized protein n=1 Tax=Halogeometricum borinquense TaxID=60847 RepID=A0A482TA36_9EURY|nr:hypothetical protein [Halogeometricum borinquense]RYJ13582.1 hypothetical protein ELS19_06175 [Halogeometricum borinquense]